MRCRAELLAQIVAVRAARAYIKGAARLISRRMFHVTNRLYASLYAITL